MNINHTKLLGVLMGHAGPSLYCGKNIPRDKLDNAIANFPIGIRETVIGLIDNTVFGSCKRGLAITLNGLVWKNSWATETAQSRMTWPELIAAKHTVEVDGNDLRLAPGVVIELIGQMKGPQLARLCFELIDCLTDGEVPESRELDDESEAHIVATVLATIGMCAKLARADGAITRPQIEWLSEYFDDLAESPEDKQVLIDCFKAAKDDATSIYDHAKFFGTTASVEGCESLYELLWDFAMADGTLSPAKGKILRAILPLLEIASTRFAEIRAQYFEPDDNDDADDWSRRWTGSDRGEFHSHYQILECRPDASNEELRAAFKRKISAFHPDKLQSKGLADEFIQFATQQSQRINEAYEVLMAHRRERA